MKKILFALASTVLLASCGETGSNSGELREREYIAKSEPMMEVEEKMISDAPSAAMNDNLPQRAGLYLAYTHSRTIEVPANDLKTLLDSHANACTQAGPKKCLVSSSGVNGLGTEYARGNLYLKATPEWTESFLGALPENLKQDNAQVTESNTSSIDLTAQIIDTGARLKAQKTLRDRLQNLLETREGNLEELLGVERELARVQGQIDSHESVLANLKQRVSMSDINIYYQAKVSPVSQSVWRPLGDALNGFFGNIAWALASVVTFIAFAIPWGFVLIGIIFLIRFLWRTLRKKKAPASKEADA